MYLTYYISRNFIPLLMFIFSKSCPLSTVLPRRSQLPLFPCPVCDALMLWQRAAAKKPGQTWVATIGASFFIFGKFRKFESVHYIEKYADNGQLWPLRAKATVWVYLDESTTRYAIASRLHSYWRIFKIDTSKDSCWNQLSFGILLLKIHQ